MFSNFDRLTEYKFRIYTHILVVHWIRYLTSRYQEFGLKEAGLYIIKQKILITCFVTYHNIGIRGPIRNILCGCIKESSRVRRFFYTPTNYIFDTKQEDNLERQPNNLSPLFP